MTRVHKACKAGKFTSTLERQMAGSPPIVAVANLKGGVGKSTTALMMAESLAYHYGLHVMLWDFDAQANLSELLLTSEGVQRELNQRRGLAMVLERFRPGGEAEAADFRDVVETRAATVIDQLVRRDRKNERDGWISLMPAHPGVRFLEPYLERSPGDGWFEVGDRLAEVMLQATADVRARADLIIIDCPPHVSALCRAGLKLADFYVTPTLAETLSVWGVHQFLNWLSERRMSEWLGQHRDTLPGRQFVVITRYAARSRTHERTLKQLQDDWSGRAFAPPVRQRVSLSQELERAFLDSTHPYGGRYRGQVRADVESLADSFAAFMAERRGLAWTKRR